VRHDVLLHVVHLLLLMLKHWRLELVTCLGCCLLWLLLLLLVLCPLPAACCLPGRHRLLCLAPRDHGFVGWLRTWLLLLHSCCWWRRHEVLPHGWLMLLL
jgi:hypothetical protein